ncbi:hypothetical protein [Listeria seeligeri]|uniref:hypothetical protein n=1 Tax=Listeria seeligeri TaxID=1640 RepID=UPI001888C73D|nr:hypothetical protein [Listeria seeligeri]MBF2544887.1 hypothetical protein [Listeria seeligeri]
MTAEITENNDGSITMKHLTREQLQVFNNLFGEPTELINDRNEHYRVKPITINGKNYAYSVYGSPNNGEDTYTIGIQKLSD